MGPIKMRSHSRDFQTLKERFNFPGWCRGMSILVSSFSVFTGRLFSQFFSFHPWEISTLFSNETTETLNIPKIQLESAFLKMNKWAQSKCVSAQKSLKGSISLAVSRYVNPGFEFSGGTLIF